MPDAVGADNGGFLPTTDPTGQYDPNKPKRPVPFVRQPLGTLVANQPEQNQEVPTAAADKAPPVAASTDDSAQGGLLPATTKAAPPPQPQQPQPPQPPSPMGLPPGAFSPDAANGVATAPVRRQQPLDAAQGYANLRSGLGPEPTWNTLPEEQKHHGARKALDTIGSVLYGGLTLNPMAGLALHQQLSRAPLREAQQTYESQAGELEGGYKRQMELAKQGTAEDVAQTRELTAQQRLETSQRQTSAAEQRATELGKKITRYYKDANGNWKGEQADGQVVDAVPPPDQRDRDNAGDKVDEQVQARTREADKLGLTGEDRKYYIVNGKLKEPGTNIHIPSAESERYNDWKKQFRTENGRDPNAKETEAFNHPERQTKSATTFKTTADVDKYSDAWYSKRRQQVRLEKSEIRKNPDMEEPEKQREYGEIEKQYTQDANQFENRKKQYYGAVRSGQPVSVDENGEQSQEGGAQPAPTQKPTQPAAPAQPAPAQGQTIKTKSGKSVTIGQPVVVGGKLGKITGVRNGKPLFTPDGEGAPRGSL